MRMSCNGCRVLRKGCSEDCPIKPCLSWIKSSESQANATLFLAKFYGRAGLFNLLNAGPDHLRPAIFQSLLYEACGRIVYPVCGAPGLMWSGSWQLCQDAVEAVLSGLPITQASYDSAINGQGPPPHAYDIRHVAKTEKGSSDHSLRGQFKFPAVNMLTRPADSDRIPEPVRASESHTVEDGTELELELTLGYERTTLGGKEGGRLRG
ncbi:hypothetical protein SAY87_007731 [Trapa incisa]|uniref:LOB domain-containing protein n=1 Tax=Trapa incisa TaxID=236973 RepID=A0AAN7KEW0_9MYRT|nr:hypothetical protein SAY87_007731 [Trapa incisa]